MALAEWENPAYDTDLEPRELKLLQCQGCGAQWARVQCQLCSQQLCRGCELNIHSKISDAAAHQESLGPCNTCEDCLGRGAEFYCKDCGRYQCEGCCAAFHTKADGRKSHVWLCTEGASSGQLRFSRWAPEYIEHVKMARRNAQLEMEKQLAIKEEVATLPEYIPLPAVASEDEDDDATSDEVEQLGKANPEQIQDAVNVKMERVRLDDRVDNVTDAVAPSVAEETMQKESLSEAEPVPVKSEMRPEDMDQEPAQVDTSEVVGQDQGEKTSEDVHVKDESRVPVPDKEAPVLSVSLGPPTPSGGKDEQGKEEHEEDPDVEFVEPPPVAAEVVDLTGDDDEDNLMPGHSNVKKEEPSWSRAAANDFSLDSDPIRCQLLKAYNSQTKRIQEAQLHSERLTQRVTSTTNFQEIQGFKQQLDALQATTVNATQGRDASLARLLVYMKHNDPGFQKSLRESALNMPDAEAAIHRECARLQAQINTKGAELQLCRAQVDEAIRMKPAESFAEVLRLGNDIAALEVTIRELEKTRLDQLGNLCYVSEAIRVAARAMMGASTAQGSSAADS